MKPKPTRKCPKCKDKTSLLIDLDTLDGYVVRCTEPLGCGYEGQQADTIREALENWNNKLELRK